MWGQSLMVRGDEGSGVTRDGDGGSVTDDVTRHGDDRSEPMNVKVGMIMGI